MKAVEFRAMSPESLTQYRQVCLERQNAGALMEVDAFVKYLDKEVKVVKGRKVPVGTVGKVFWIGMANYSKYGNWWSWEVRVGFKDEGGETYFVSERNIELVA